LVPLRDSPEELFILINGVLKEPQQGLCIDRRRDNPGVERRRPTLRVDLAEVEQEFESVVADFEIVGVSTGRLAVILRVLAMIIRRIIR
jgi:hypothetical protein